MYLDPVYDLLQIVVPQNADTSGHLVCSVDGQEHGALILEIGIIERHSSSDAAKGRARDISDQEHDSDRRGEHRYPDANQTPAERQARKDRDNLKHKLGARRSSGE
jgi:hypothetical protein